MHNPRRSTTSWVESSALTQRSTSSYERMLDDGELAPFFEAVEMSRQGAHQKAFLSTALGGPRIYAGRELADAHAQLNIEDRHFDLLTGHLATVLTDLGVSPSLIDDVVSAIDELRHVVVVRGGPRGILQ